MAGTKENSTISEETDQQIKYKNKRDLSNMSDSNQVQKQVATLLSTFQGLTVIDVLLAARQEGQEHDVSVHAPVSTLPQTQPATTVHHQLDGGQKVITHDALNDLVEDSEGKHFFSKQ